MSLHAITQQEVLSEKDYVQRSHKRCKEYKIDSNRVVSSSILKQAELIDKKEKKWELIDTAIPIMNNLYDFVKGSNFFAILTDEEGCILTVMGDEKILLEAFSFKMIPGASMNEKCIGTNAMGTCIVEEKPVQISGEEHFVKGYHRWTCSAAPIRNAKGDIIGTLDLTGYSDLVHCHTLGMVIAASNAIEKTLEINEYTKKLAISERYNDAILNSIKKGILTTDLQGNIVTINKCAAEMFGYEMHEMKNMAIGQLIKHWSKIRNNTILKGHVIDEEVEVYAINNKAEFNLNSYVILDEEEKPKDIIHIVNEIKKSRKTARKITSGHAIYTFDKIIGKDKNFIRSIEFAKKIADSRSNILIMGESGTGKELFSQAIHNQSDRKNEPFVALNCGAIPRNLIESELFGYEEGSFTGAKSSGHPGKFEIASGGTMFLDEIGDMPLDLQTRLLRVIEEGTVSRIGSAKEKLVDVRIIAATNKNLLEEVEKGNFRKDLFYRLYVLPILVPPLRERKGDIPLLIEYFMKKISKKLNKRIVEIPSKHFNMLVEYHWPGNIRELENYIELIINTESIPYQLLSEGEKTTESLRQPIEYKDSPLLSLQDMEKNHIERALKVNQCNVSHTAKALGVARNTLYRKIKEYEISC